MRNSEGSIRGREEEIQIDLSSSIQRKLMNKKASSKEKLPVSFSQIIISKMQAIKLPLAFLSSAAVLAAIVLAQSSSNEAESSTASTNNTVNIITPGSLAVQSLPFTSRNWSEPYAPETLLSEFQSQQDVSSTPHFQVFDHELAKAILGDSPNFQLLIHEPGYAFAHEAPVYFKDGVSSFHREEKSSDHRSDLYLSDPQLLFKCWGSCRKIKCYHQQ